MENRGRKKKTDEERKASNSRQTNDANGGKGAKIVTLAKLTKKPPHHLTDDQKAVWRDFITECQGNRAVRVPDKAEIVHYCEMTVRAHKLKSKIDIDGEILEKITDKGNKLLYKHPAVEILFTLNKELRSIRKDFGMSPIGRKKIDIEISEVEYVEGPAITEDDDKPDEYGFTAAEFEEAMDGMPGPE